MKYIGLIIFLISIIYTEISSQEDLFLPEISDKLKQNNIRELKDELNNLLKSKDLKNTKMSVTVYSLDNKEFYYQKNSELALTPASLTKLFTTYTALYLLGTDYMIKTSIYTDGEIRDSVIHGNLYLYGRGDALFSVTDLKSVINKISQMGIKQINGDIIADGSYFDTLTNRLDYSNDNDIVEPLPPITALSLERNTISIIVEGEKANGNANIYTIPASDNIVISNKVRLRADASTNLDSIIEKKAKINKYENFVGDAPRRRRRRKSVRVTTSVDNNGIQKFYCSGHIYKNKHLYFSYFAKNPLLVISGAVKKYLEFSGIKVNGKAIIGKVPKEILSKPDLVNFSRPLYELIYHTNKESDNYLAENIFKIIGAYLGKSNSVAEQSRKIQSLIFHNSGIECQNCLLNDGSGLSRRNLVTTKAIVQLLVKSQLLPFDDLFYNSLPIAGIDGTLEKRMRNSVAEYNVSAKTGTLKNVSGLAGFVSTMDGEFLAFAVIFNGPYVYNYKIYEDKIATLLASFSYN